MASKLSLYSQLARPFTLLPPLLGIVSGSVCAFGSVHNPDPARLLSTPVVLTVILGSLCASFMNAASNAINQIYDLEIDRLNKPSRPLVTGALSVREAWIFTWIFYALALIPTWLVVPFPYNTLQQKLTAPLSEHVTFFIYLAGLVFTFVYSAPELGRTKIRGMWANLTIAIPRGVLLKVAGWAMVAHVTFTEPWYIGGVIGFFLIGAASTIVGRRAGPCTSRWSDLSRHVRAGDRRAHPAEVQPRGRRPGRQRGSVLRHRPQVRRLRRPAGRHLRPGHRASLVRVTPAARARRPAARRSRAEVSGFGSGPLLRQMVAAGVS